MKKWIYSVNISYVRKNYILLCHLILGLDPFNELSMTNQSGNKNTPVLQLSKPRKTLIVNQAQ